MADNCDEVGKESNNDESFSKEGENVLFLSGFGVVWLIVSISESSVNSVSLVDGEVENDLPNSPKEYWDDWHNGSSSQFTSGGSLVFSEEINSNACRNSKWNFEQESNKCEPPWDVFVG